MQELLDSPNEKDPANGPPNQMCAAALRFHAVGPAELRSRLCRLPASLRSLAVPVVRPPILRARSGRYVTNKSAYEKKVREIAAKFPAP